MFREFNSMEEELDFYTRRQKLYVMLVDIPIFLTMVAVGFYGIHVLKMCPADDRSQYELGIIIVAFRLEMFVYVLYRFLTDRSAYLLHYTVYRATVLYMIVVQTWSSVVYVSKSPDYYMYLLVSLDVSTVYMLMIMLVINLMASNVFSVTEVSIVARWALSGNYV